MTTSESLPISWVHLWIPAIRTKKGEIAKGTPYNYKLGFTKFRWDSAGTSVRSFANGELKFGPGRQSVVIHIVAQRMEAYELWSTQENSKSSSSINESTESQRVVTQQYVLVLSVSVKYVLRTYLCYLYYLYRLYYWSTYLRGLAVHLYRLFTLRGLAVQISKISTSFNVVLPHVIQHLIFTTHIYIT